MVDVGKVLVKVAAVLAGDGVQVRQPGGGEQRAVGGRQVGGIDGVRLRPAQRLALPGARLAVPGGDFEGVQHHVPGGVVDAGGVVVVVADEGFGGDHVDAEFLAQLARQCRRRGFAGFELAAREFPAAGEVAARRASTQQHGSVGPAQHTDGDRQRRGGHGAGLRCGTRR